MELIHYELIKSKIPFEREKEIVVNYKGIILAHKFYIELQKDCTVDDNLPRKHE